MPDGLNKLWERLSSVEGRLLVMESKANDWSDAIATIHDLRVALGKLHAQTKITWGFMFALILSLIGVALSVFSGGVP